MFRLGTNWNVLAIPLVALIVLVGRVVADSPKTPSQSESSSSSSESDASKTTQPASSGSDSATSESEKSDAKKLPGDKRVAEDRSSRASARAKGELTFDDLKFEMEKGGKFERSMLTKDIETLHKRDIKIRGYILPASTFKLSGITEFVLVRDNQECCFGPGAALYDCIIINMAKGKTAEFSTRPVTVRGKFELKEFKYPDSDQHYAIYFITATEVK